MAVPAVKLVADFYRKFDSVSSARRRDIPLIDVVAYLNDAQEEWFRAVTKVADADEQMRQDLRPVHVKSRELSYLDQGEYGVAEIPGELYRRLNQRVTARYFECCGDMEKTFPLRIANSDDQNEDARNTYRTADFLWEQVFGSEGDRGLYIYHQGKMEIRKVVIDYYRKPAPIHAPSLSLCEGQYYYDYRGVRVTQDSDFEFDGRGLDSRVVDIAVLMAKRDVGELQDFQLRLATLLQLDNQIKN